LIDRVVNYDLFPTGTPDGEIGLPNNIQLQKLVLFWNYSLPWRLDAFVPTQVNTERLRRVPDTCPTPPRSHLCARCQKIETARLALLKIRLILIAGDETIYQ